VAIFQPADGGDGVVGGDGLGDVVDGEAQGL
jgi:hypothetical protein